MHSVIGNFTLFILVFHICESKRHVTEFSGEHVLLLLGLGLEGLVGVDEFTDLLEGLLVLELGVGGVHLGA